MWAARSGDDGFTLIEVMVATSLIGIVMAALMTFFSATIGVTNQQSGVQTAAQLATDGIEAARARPIAALLADPPVDGTPPRRNGVTFTRTWSVSSCWQPPAGGDCGAQVAGHIPFVRVVVRVTWRDRRCAVAQCSYTTATLLSANVTEPLFTP